MKRNLLALLCVVAFVSSLSGLVYASDKQDSGQVTLAAELSPEAVKIVTPLEAMDGGKKFSISGGQGQMTIGGANLAVAGATLGGANYIGLDVNGNGTVDKDELKKVPSSGIGFKLKSAGGEDYAVVFTKVVVYGDSKKVTAIMGACAVACAYKGAINGIPFRILDDNLDGAFTQDGKDAIAIGKSLAGVPLMHVHDFGGEFYRLTVAKDGAGVGFEKVSNAETGVVKLPSESVFRCVVLSGQDGAYDVKVSGATGIPAGKYKLLYGMVGGDGGLVPFTATQESPVYDIQAGMCNTLRIGAPLRVDFTGGFTGANVTVNPDLRILGAADELYKFEFGGKMGTPNVTLKAGTKDLTSSNMAYG